MILLSYYSSESAPLSIIEALQCGIPVVATKIGDIEQMLTCSSGKAGIVIELEEGKVSVNKTSQNLISLIEDKDFYGTCKKNANIKAKEFSINVVVRQYLEVFDDFSQRMLLEEK